MLLNVNNNRNNNSNNNNNNNNNNNCVYYNIFIYNSCISFSISPDLLFSLQRIRMDKLLTNSPVFSLLENNLKNLWSSLLIMLYVCECVLYAYCGCCFIEKLLKSFQLSYTNWWPKILIFNVGLKKIRWFFFLLFLLGGLFTWQPFKDELRSEIFSYKRRLL